MKCRKCQTENPDGMKFCVECGNKLEAICPKCGFGNAPSYKFCGECGHNLTLPSEPIPKSLSFDEKLDKIQRYLPKGLTEKILAQKDKIEGERKQVTVMFCDMEGFTPLVEKLGPEEAYGIMDQVYEILIHKVHDYGGTVNEMTGDGIMALFGAPIALEDVPQRAIRSAIAIHREMARFSDKARQEKEKVPSLKMRIGVHTGPVVVGTLGNNLRVEFKAVGDTVNLASRMEGLAEPGTTYVTEETFKLTEGLFRFNALGEKEIKGKEKPVRIYRVIAPSTRRTRFDVSAERGLTPFVGRQRELDLLLDAFERAKAGRGQAISIMSEAGAGKSRLLYEFRKAVANEDVTFLEGTCLSYSRGVAYHPVIDILKSNFDLQEGEGDSEIRQKVGNGLKALGADEATTLPYLLELLSVKDSGIDKIMMSPEGKRDRIIEALKRIVLKGSEIRPLIIAFEDLHWVDKSSENLLKYLVESIPVAAVFLIFTYRTEFVQTWGAKSFHSQITLNRLSNRESIAVATHILGTEDLDRYLEELIVEKTEGVPFFIEEFIRSFLDLKVIERENGKYQLSKVIKDVTIPSTIQDVIMARVDSMPDAAKSLLQTGSVIEREFSYELIRRVTGLSEQELLSHLSALKDSELLYERGTYPESSYVFRHALTRELVYDSILSRRKKKLHGKIGHAMESLFKENLNEHYGLLSEHFTDSENYEKGAEYSKLAGKRAQKKFAVDEAISYAKKRVACLEKMPRSDAVQRNLIDARTLLAGYYLTLNYHVEAKYAVAPIADLALDLGYLKRLPAIYTAIGSHDLYVEENYSEGVPYLTEAIKISEDGGDFVSLWFAAYFLGGYLSANCKFEEGLHYLKKTLDLSDAANNQISLSTAKSTISTFNYVFEGNINLAYQTSEESLSTAIEIDDIFAKGIAYVSHGVSCYSKGLFNNAVDNVVKGLSFCEKSNHVIWQGWASFWLGEMFDVMYGYEKATDHFKKAIAFFMERGGFAPSFINISKVYIKGSSISDSKQDIKWSRLFEYYEKIKVKALLGWAARYIGKILLDMNDRYLSDAEGWVQKAIETDKRNKARWFLARDYALYAELFMRKGDQSRAKENIAKAIDIFKECGADGWVEKSEKEIDEFS
jgi:class 3 adenylate cyclase/tetratricopeptide (TPR) repeat protein